MSTSSCKPFLIVQIARNAEWRQETDLHLITILNLFVGIVMANVKALMLQKVLGQIQSDFHIINWVCPRRDNIIL